MGRHKIVIDFSGEKGNKPVSLMDSVKQEHLVVPLYQFQAASRSGFEIIASF